MFLGDTHGNSFWVERVVEVAKRRDVELILQLGDFGLWPGEGGLRFRDNTEAALSKAGLEMWVTGGNHEDYDQVDLAYEYDTGLGPLDPWAIEEHIKWLPRGYRFELDGTRFLSLGGAYSIDKMWRTPHRSWWPQEELTEADVERAISVDDPKVDVMLTHDIPWGANPGWNRKAFPECLPNQRRIRTVVDECRPKWLFHGHLHYRYVDLLNVLGGHTVRVEGLDCDGSPLDASWEIRDTALMDSIMRDFKETQIRIEEMYPLTHPANRERAGERAQPPVWP